MDNLLAGLFGGSDDDDDNKRQQRATDFVQRVDRGSPYDGFTEEEALHNYQQVAGNLSDEEYMDASRDAFERLSPEERREFARFLREQGAADRDDVDDPSELTRLTNSVRSNQGSGIAGLLGGGGGGLLGGGGGGGGLMGALGGMMGGSQGGGGGALGNPMLKAVLGTIAASAMRKYMR